MTVLESLLEAARAEVRETHQKAEVTVCCPFCETRGFSSDVNYHLGLNVMNGKAHCFRCDWKSGNALYTARQLRRVFDLEFNLEERELQRRAPEKKKAAADLKPVALPDGFELLTGKLDFVGRKVRDYLEARGVSLLQMVRHRIGYATSGRYAWRAVFPVMAADGRTYGFVGRTVAKDVEPKYLNSPGLKMLWNGQSAGTTAVVVEGVMDALRVEQALMGVAGMTVVARLGSTITSIQIEQLRRYEEGLVLFPDFDLPGLRGAMELGERLQQAGLEKLSVVVPEGASGEDPGGMDRAAILECVRGAQPWNAGTPHRLRLASGRRSTR